MEIEMGDVRWTVEKVPADDHRLSGSKAVTDILELEVLVSEEFFEDKVLLHELAHVAMASYGYLDMLDDSVCHKDELGAEEVFCELLSEHGPDIFNKLEEIQDGFGNIESSGWNDWW